MNHASLPLALPLLAALAFGCAVPDEVDPDAIDPAEGEGEGEGEGEAAGGDNQATLADGTQYVFERVLQLASVDGRVTYEATDASGYWSVSLDVPDSPGSFTCDEGGFTFVFSDFFLPFSSEHVESTCGVEVTEAPYTNAGRFVGTYEGTLVSEEQGRQERTLTGRFEGTVAE